MTAHDAGSPQNHGKIKDEDFDLSIFIDMFNRGRFFDAHEVLEDVWRSVPNLPSRRLLRLHLQGMIQLAVAFHHASTGNRAGARSVLERAVRNLDGADTSFPDLDFDQLFAGLADWRQYLSAAIPPPNQPQIRRKPAP
jgi:uncharacterized protein